jgi:hypothetical protein
LCGPGGGVNDAGKEDERACENAPESEATPREVEEVGARGEVDVTKKQVKFTSKELAWLLLGVQGWSTYLALRDRRLCRTGNHPRIVQSILRKIDQLREEAQDKS